MKEELIIKVLTKSSNFLTDEQVSQLRMVLIEELYPYKIASECTELIVSGDFPNKAALFLACKKLDGFSKHTLSNYKLILRHFYSVMPKDVDQITTMDIRMYLSLRSKDGIKKKHNGCYYWVSKIIFYMARNRRVHIEKPYA